MELPTICVRWNVWMETAASDECELCMYRIKGGATGQTRREEGRIAGDWVSDMSKWAEGGYCTGRKLEYDTRLTIR